jgi:hypothetical protein
MAASSLPASRVRSTSKVDPSSSTPRIPEKPRRSPTNAVGAVFEVVGRWALTRIYSGVLVQTNGVLGPDEWMCARESRITVMHSSPKRRGMSHNFGTDGGEINMDQAFNAPIMAIRFGLATGRRRATVQSQWCSPRRRRRSLHRPAGLDPRRRARTRLVVHQHKHDMTTFPATSAPPIRRSP